VGAVLTRAKIDRVPSRAGVWHAIALLAALALTGCGSAASNQQGVSFGGRGDSAMFAIDGRSISVTESGRASVKIAQAPELTYSGPVGCAGRYFTADFTDGVPLFFHYSSSDAYLLVGSDLYYLGGGAHRIAGKLEWDTTSDGHQIAISVGCPPPPRSGPLTGSSTPSACSVLTAAIAASTLHERVKRPKFVQENPDLSYCEYKSVDKSFNGDRRLAVSVATANELTSLSSWQQPRIAGIGDEAHGGDASLGLAVRKGKLGIEVDADLGFKADNASDLAAEEAVAHELLVRLRG
jgi:hypothetical protein